MSFSFALSRFIFHILKCDFSPRRTRIRRRRARWIQRERILLEYIRQEPKTSFLNFHSLYIIRYNVISYTLEIIRYWLRVFDI